MIDMNNPATWPGLPPAQPPAHLIYDPFIGIPGYHPNTTNQQNTSAQSNVASSNPVNNSSYQSNMSSGPNMPGLPPTQPTGNIKYDPFYGLDGDPNAKESPNAIAWNKALGYDKPAQPNNSGAPGYLKTIGAGLGKGFGDMMLGGQQLVGEGLNKIGLTTPGNWLVKDAETGIHNLTNQFQPYQNSNPATAYASQIAGETVPLVLDGPGDAVTGAGNLVSKLLDGKSIASKLISKGLSGAAQGAVASTLLPVAQTDEDNGYWSQKLGQLESGAAGGAAGSYIGSALGRIISPAVSPGVTTLMKEGITPTPGQIIGGAANTMEQKATSLPGLGDFIQGARKRAVDELNLAVANRALEPIGEKVESAPGRDMVGEVQDKLGQAYDELLPKMTFTPDEQFGNDMQKIISDGKILEPNRASQFNNILANKFYAKLAPDGSMDGQTLKGVQSELSRLGTGYLGEPSLDAREMGGRLLDTKDALEQGLIRTNPDYADQLSNINQGYANYVRLRAAAGMQGANEGVFSAAQLSNAVRRGDYSRQKGSFASGRAFMQDLSDPAKKVLGNAVPDSGTAGRGFLGGLMAYGAYANPMLALKSAALSFPYLSPATQKLFAAALIKRPEMAPAIANLTRNSAITPLSLLNQTAPNQ